MPVSISVICIRNKVANNFLLSNLYLELEKDIYMQRNENGNLYLAMSLSRAGFFETVSEMDSSDYLYLTVDDEDDLGINGSFIPSKEVDLVVNMSIVAKNVEEEKIRNYHEYYNHDFLKNLEKHDLKKLKELIFENGQIKDMIDDDDIKNVEAICPDYNWDEQVQKWAFFELGCDTSLSTESVFILKFQPSLKNLIKWEGIIDDELNEWQSEYEGNKDNFAYSLYETENYDLLETLEEQLELEGDEGLRNYPSIIFFGLNGNPQSGWE